MVDFKVLSQNLTQTEDK